MIFVYAFFYPQDQPASPAAIAPEDASNTDHAFELQRTDSHSSLLHHEDVEAEDHVMAPSEHTDELETAPVEDNIDALELLNMPLRLQLRSAEFAFIAVYTWLNMLWLNMYLGTVSEQLKQKFDETTGKLIGALTRHSSLIAQSQQ